MLLLGRQVCCDLSAMSARGRVQEWGHECGPGLTGSECAEKDGSEFRVAFILTFNQSY